MPRFVMGAFVLPWVAGCTSVPAPPAADRPGTPTVVAEGDAVVAEGDAVDPPAATGGRTVVASPDCVDVPPEPPAPPRHEYRRTVPTKPQTFGPVTCMADREVWFDDEGRMRVCTVAKAVRVYDVPVAADAYTHFHPDGRPEQTTISRAMTLTTANGLKVSCAADFVSLSATGSLEHCKLAGAMRIRDIPCRAGESIAFHPTGELHGATVDVAYVTPLGTVPAGTSLQWYPSGALAGGWLAEEAKLDGHPARSNFEVHENGQLAAFVLAAPETVQGHAFEAWAELKLRPDGTLQAAKFEVDSGFMPHGERWEDYKSVRYRCDGTVLDEHVDHRQDNVPERLH